MMKILKICNFLKKLFGNYLLLILNNNVILNVRIFSTRFNHIRSLPKSENDGII